MELPWLPKLRLLQKKICPNRRRGCLKVAVATHTSVAAASGPSGALSRFGMRVSRCARIVGPLALIGTSGLPRDSLASKVMGRSTRWGTPGLRQPPSRVLTGGMGGEARLSLSTEARRGGPVSLDALKPPGLPR